jgi:hypothetical protein
VKKSRWTVPILVTAAILGIQTLGLWGVGVVFVIDTFTKPANSLAGAIFLDIMIVASAAAMSAAIVWFLRGVSSTRSAIIVWQMTAIGIGIASAQGVEPQWVLALTLIVPATIVTVFMLFSREVSRHLDPDA